MDTKSLNQLLKIIIYLNRLLTRGTQLVLGKKKLNTFTDIDPNDDKDLFDNIDTDVTANKGMQTEPFYP